MHVEFSTVNEQIMTSNWCERGHPFPSSSAYRVQFIGLSSTAVCCSSI